MSASTEKPSGIECQYWELNPSDPKKRRCLFYIDGGKCELSTRIMCVEWLKRGGKPTIPAGSASGQSQSSESALTPGIAVATSSPTAFVANGALPRGLPASVDQLLVRPDPPASKRVLGHPGPSEPPGPFALSAPPPKPAPKAGAGKAALAAARRLRGEGLADVVGASLAGEQYEVLEPIDPKSIEALEALGVEIVIDTPVANGEPLVMLASYTDQDRNEVTFKDAATIRQLLDAFPGSRVTQFKSPPKSRAVIEPEPESEEAVETRARTSFDMSDCCAACGLRAMSDTGVCAKCGATKLVQWDGT